MTMSYNSHTSGGFKNAFNSLRCAIKMSKIGIDISDVKLQDMEDNDPDAE